MQKICPLVIFILLAFAAFSAPAQTPQPSPAPKKANSRPAEEPLAKEPFEKAPVEEMKSQCVRLETEKGLIEAELYPESAPESVRNFLNLVAIGAFDTTTFSRVVPNFVIQGGDVETRYQKRANLLARANRIIPDEPNKIKHERGILSMARADEPNTTSSHFFILVRDASYLDGKYAAFGRVTRGMETVDAINKMPVKNETPDFPVRITRATIFPCSGAPK